MRRLVSPIAMQEGETEDYSKDAARAVLDPGISRLSTAVRSSRWKLRRNRDRQDRLGYFRRGRKSHRTRHRHLSRFEDRRQRALPHAVAADRRIHYSSGVTGF